MGPGEKSQLEEDMDDLFMSPRDEPEEKETTTTEESTEESPKED